jgi:hypothetical protein
MRFDIKSVSMEWREMKKGIESYVIIPTQCNNGKLEPVENCSCEKDN